ncbi:unnamed protein product, partial [Phaeothamnion confervicola]
DGTIGYLDGDEVIHHFRRRYESDHVLAQLLRWHNDGHGTDTDGALGSDLLGCVRLPDVLSAYAGYATAPYGPTQRVALLRQLADAGQRKHPWPKAVAAAFSEDGFVRGHHGSASAPTLYGSPVLDAVLGDTDGLGSVLAALRQDLGPLGAAAADGPGGNGSGSSGGGSGRYGWGSGVGRKKEGKVGLEDVADLPAGFGGSTTWVQCEGCLKWRKVPFHVDLEVAVPGGTFFCRDNTWHPEKADCEVPADPYEDDPDATWQPPEVGEVEVGDWVDAYCERTRLWYPAKIIKLGYDDGTVSAAAPVAAAAAAGVAAGNPAARSGRTSGSSGVAAGDGAAAGGGKTGGNSGFPDAMDDGEGGGGENGGEGGTVDIVGGGGSGDNGGGGCGEGDGRKVTRVLVHFYKWNSKYDEWLHKDAKALTTVHTRTEPIPPAREWHARKYGCPLPGADGGTGVAGNGGSGSCGSGGGGGSGGSNGGPARGGGGRGRGRGRGGSRGGRGRGRGRSYSGYGGVREAYGEENDGGGANNNDGGDWDADEAAGLEDGVSDYDDLPARRPPPPPPKRKAEDEEFVYYGVPRATGSRRRPRSTGAGDADDGSGGGGEGGGAREAAGAAEAAWSGHRSTKRRASADSMAEVSSIEEIDAEAASALQALSHAPVAGWGLRQPSPPIPPPAEMPLQPPPVAMAQAATFIHAAAGNREYH